MLYFLKDVIFRETSFPVILQAFIGTVGIPTYISYYYIEHLCTSELGSCRADYLCHSFLSCEMFMLHDNLHHLMLFDVLSSVPSYSYVTR